MFQDFVDGVVFVRLVVIGCWRGRVRGSFGKGR